MCPFQAIVNVIFRFVHQREVLNRVSLEIIAICFTLMDCALPSNHKLVVLFFFLSVEINKTQQMVQSFLLQGLSIL